MEVGLPQRYQKPEKIEHLRDTHEDIIGGGMKIISDAYLAPLLAKADKLRLKAIPLTPEGRNYVQFLRILRETGASLMVLGSEGLGKVPESPLGSFAERTLLLGSGTDILLMRREWAASRGPIIVGVDGSAGSYMALRKAAEFARQFSTELTAVAVYDPFFHTGVFSSISGALTKDQASRFNFAAQQKLHDEIIDDGLRALYEKRMAKGIEQLGTSGISIKTEVLTGKVFPQISHYASVVGASLVVVGRFGVHREDISLIGSTAHALARTCPTNLLIVDSENRSAADSVSPSAGARSGSSSAATIVSHDAVGTRSDTNPPASPSLKENLKEAEVVTLKKAKRLAPSFHEHIVRARIVGAEVQPGTRYMVFDIIATEPSGKVRVTDRTRLEFVS